MKIGSTSVPPLREADAEEALLDYGVDTAKQVMRCVTHDFNNLISVVRGYASVMQGLPNLDEDSRQWVGFIDQAGSELAGLTERMARFAENREIDLIRLNLNTVLEEFVSQTKTDTPRDIEVRVRLGSPMPDFMGDRALIQEACRNLWQNAIDSMPSGGILSWQTKFFHPDELAESHWKSNHPAGYVSLQVRDTGTGMDDGTLARMFSPFFTTKSGRGRGLGATVVYETVKSHGGHILVSHNPGPGICVTLYLPASDEDVEQPANNPGTGPETNKPKLLIVDDEDMVRLAVERILAHLGYDSVTAASGEEALTIYEELGDSIQTVILDITMPGLGGIETFRRLRVINDQIKVIIISGDTQSAAIREIQREGISYVIPKPFHTEHLSRALQQLVG